MIERKILDAFPGGGENKRIRRALWEIVWAFEEFDCEEALVGPQLGDIIRARQLERGDVTNLSGILMDSMLKLRTAASRIESAIIDLDLVMLDREATPGP